MDGLGYIANLHATTLSNNTTTPFLLKPVLKQSRRTSNASISDKARNFVSRRKNIFSTSSSSSTTARASTSSTFSYGSGSVSLDSRSTFTSPGSSRLPSEERVRPTKSPLSSPDQVCFFEIAEIRVEPSVLLRIERCGGGMQELDSTWVCKFVDNGYMFGKDDMYGEEGWDGCSSVQPSRPSSVIEPAWEEDNHMPVRKSEEDQLVRSFDQESHQARRSDRPYLCRPQLLPRFTQLPQARSFTARPFTATT